MRAKYLTNSLVESMKILMVIANQAKIAKRLEISPSFFCHIIHNQKRPSVKKAVELERISGISRMVWLYGDTHMLRVMIESVYGKINFAKGHPSKSKKMDD